MQAGSTEGLCAWGCCVGFKVSTTECYRKINITFRVFFKPSLFICSNANYFLLNLTQKNSTVLSARLLTFR